MVYGDIGTSPLYALNACLVGDPDPDKAKNVAPFVTPTHDNVMGVLSLMFWALTLVVVIKYLTFVLRADNKGEGGILALAALVRKDKVTWLGVPVLLALFGAGLLYGDGMITPAISVLGALEGLKVGTASFEPFIVPIAVGILVLLFLVQRHGTHRIGSVFGWIMLLWFCSIGAVGVPHILAHPGVLAAINPMYAIEFLIGGGWHGYLILGLVFLVVTGGEALYADMGHFGRTPIRFAWYVVVFPALLLNYFGQAAYLLSLPPDQPAHNAFFEMVPHAMLYPMLVLATMAAIIASQALISGAFSLTHQAVQLGYLPRVTVKHTSEKTEGQIYIPEVNWTLMMGTVAIVLAFRSTAALTAAYGIAVTGTMMITSFLYFLVTYRNWKWKLSRAVLLLILFLIMDLAFLVANSVKIADGGWLPLAVGVGIFVIMTTWWRGRFELSRIMEGGSIPEDMFLADLEGMPLPRVRGTAVFMASNASGVPNVLLHHVKHNQVLHKQVVLLSIETQSVPWVVGNRALEVKDLGKGFYRVVARSGFMQSADVPRILTRCEKHGMVTDPATTTYYLGRQTLLTTGKTRFARWRKKLFSFLTRNSQAPTNFFNLPPNRVVELGLQIEL